MTPEDKTKKGLLLCQQVRDMIKNDEPHAAIMARMNKAYKLLSAASKDNPAVMPIIALLAVDMEKDEAMTLLNQALAMPFQPEVLTALEKGRQLVLDRMKVGGNA